MANNYNLEISKWSDGTVRLVYWDSSHGDDVVIVLHPDGSASLEDVAVNQTPIESLGKFLIDLEARINSGGK